tara:strand:- start:11826 stop:13094 length:1269 start_codon:yes stop_codon:yes gene_type:complete
VCTSASRKKFYKNNREKLNVRNSKYRENNREKLRKYRKNNPEKRNARNRKWRKNNPEKHRASVRKSNQRPEAKKRINARRRERMKTDPQFKLRMNLSSRLGMALKGKLKSASTMALLGCSYTHAKEHLEKQFQPGMTWENHGTWHIDHMMPCASFDLSCPEQQRRCFHYTNLQPMWGKENMSKSDKIIYNRKWTGTQWVNSEEEKYNSNKKSLQMAIVFKSNSKEPYFFLSNFYGGSEFTYMSMRTNNPSLRALYISLRDNMDYKTFKSYRERLMRKKIYKEGKKDHYVKTYNGKQYYGFGVIAKLISACWKTSMKKRLEVVNQIAQERGLTGDIKQEDFLMGTDEENKQFMKIALRLKFASEPYRSVLLGTGANKVYERQGNRGKSLWAGEDGWLGLLLMQIRDELQGATLGKRKRLQLKF